MIKALKARFLGWVFIHKSPQAAGPILLSRRHIFILPTRTGLAFGFTLLLMLVGSINYNLSLGYLLTFLLGAFALLAILHTFRNLAKLQVSTSGAEAVFAGDSAEVALWVENSSSQPRYSIGVAIANGPTEFIDIPAHQTVSARLLMPTERRGLLQLGTITIMTQFPVGLYRAWAKLEFHMQCIVYPRPDLSTAPLPSQSEAFSGNTTSSVGCEDFYGLRPYQPGDSQRHVAWKAVARYPLLLVKQFSGESSHELWLNWADLPANLDTEAKLSRLTRWVLRAHELGLRYGLRLPAAEIARATPDHHQRERCLEALALFGRAPDFGSR